ncbi:MAG: TadE/TadG family type IV pilus assembly protein [Sphingomonadaceae bacterium]
MRAGLLSRVRADEGGATAIEFALVAPLLLALLFGGMEIGRYLWFAAALDHAVVGAARCAGLAQATCEGDAQLAGAIEVSLRAVGVTMAVPPTAVAASPAPCGTILVVRRAYPALLPGLSPVLPQLRASACIFHAV